LTVGEEEFKQAQALARAGKTAEAIAAFERLCVEYRSSWIDRVARQRLQALRQPLPSGEGETPKDAGIAANYPGDRGIEKSPRVIFVEDFEEPSTNELKKRWESVQGPETISLSHDVPPGSAGKRSLLMTHVGGKGTGAHLYRRLPPGHDKLHARFYV